MNVQSDTKESFDEESSDESKSLCFDPYAALRASNNNSATVQKLVELVDKDLAERFPKLEDAIVNKDSKEAELQAHSMAGELNYFGPNSFQETMHSAEIAATKSQFDVLESTLPELRWLLEKFCQDINVVDWSTLSPHDDA